MRCLLTGGTGFVGANVARHLIAAGHAVRCLVRKPNLCIEGLPVELRTADLLDVEALAREADGCDAILHVAGTFDPGPGGAERMLSLHVDATTALMRAAERAKVPKFLFCSSSITVGFGPLEAPGDEDSPLDADRIYGRTGPLRAYYDSKIEAERRVLGGGGVVVNPDYVLGAWDIKPTSGQLLLTLAKGPVPFHPRGGKCFVDADDCAAAHLLALTRGRPGRRYLLGNHNVSYRDFMALCAGVAGRSPPRIPVPDLALQLAGRAGALLQRRDPHRFAGLDRHVLLAMQQGRYRDGRRAREELGMPVTPLAESVRKAWDWFGAHGYLRR